MLFIVELSSKQNVWGEVSVGELGLGLTTKLICVSAKQPGLLSLKTFTVIISPPLIVFVYGFGKGLGSN